MKASQSVDQNQSPKNIRHLFVIRAFDVDVSDGLFV